jgi:hypothetical protein
MIGAIAVCAVLSLGAALLTLHRVQASVGKAALGRG